MMNDWDCHVVIEEGDDKPIDAPPIPQPLRDALGGSEVTDRMIDYVWPNLYVLLVVLSRFPDLEVVEYDDSAKDKRRKAKIVNAFLALMQHDVELFHYVVTQVTERGQPRDQARETVRLICADLFSWAKRKQADAKRGRTRGKKPSSNVSTIVDDACSA
jgi:hypothetical protein